MKNRILLLTGAIVTIAGIAGIFYYNHISSPQYSLQQVKIAYEQHDIALFEKYVDIKTLTDGMLDNIMRELDTRSTAFSSAERLGENLGKGLINLMRPQVEELWRQQILKLVESGEIDASKGRQGLQELWFKNDKTSFNKITEITKDGKVALIGLEFNHARFGTNLILKLRMRDKGNYWQLFEISNLFEYVKALDSLEGKRVDKLNEQVKQDISEVLHVSKIDVKTQVVTYYNTYKDFTYNVDFENVSHDEIVKIRLDFGINDSNGNEVESGYIAENGVSLKPGEKYSYHKKDNMASYRKVIPKNLQVDIKAGGLTFRDGSKIEWQEKWEDLSTK